MLSLGIGKIGVGLFAVGIGLVIANFALRGKEGRKNASVACLVLGIVAILAGGICLVLPNVDVISKFSYGEGDDGDPPVSPKPSSTRTSKTTQSVPSP